MKLIEYERVTRPKMISRGMKAHHEKRKEQKELAFKRLHPSIEMYDSEMSK